MVCNRVCACACPQLSIPTHHNRCCFPLLTCGQYLLRCCKILIVAVVKIGWLQVLSGRSVSGLLGVLQRRAFSQTTSTMTDSIAKKFVPAERIADATPSIWVEFTALAAETQSVNLGQGFPDYPVPSRITDALSKAAHVNEGESGLQHQYIRPYGHPALVKQLADVYARNGIKADPMKEILVTVGAYQSLFYAAVGYLNPGDEAIVIEPAYDCYVAQIEMAQAKAVPVTLKPVGAPKDGQFSSADFKLDFADFESKLNERTKLLFLNNPNNPLGKLYTREELLKIAELVKKYNLVVVADEVYEWMVYKPNKMIRFATLPDMAERTITVGSAGKTFNCTGWKLGWAVAPEKLLWPLKAIHQNCVFTCSTVLQAAAANAMEAELSLFDDPAACYLHNVADELKAKRDRMAASLKAAGLTPVVPEAGYFMMADFSALPLPDTITNDKSTDPLDYKFVRYLARQHLAGIPPTGFYTPQNKAHGQTYIRFCFFKKDETLDAAEKILKKAFAK